MSSPPQKITTHHEDPVFYSIAHAELLQLKDKAKVSEKENCFFLAGLFVPAFINLFSIDLANEKPLSVLAILNLLVVVVTFVLGIFQGKGWWEKRTSYSDFIKTLEGRPKVEMLISGDADNYVKETTDGVS